jgi:hypothetical protein
VGKAEHLSPMLIKKYRPEVETHRMPGIVLKPSDRRAPNSLAVNDPGAYGAVTGLTSHGEEGILEGVHGVQKTCL